MTFDQYQEAMNRINERLTHISARTGRMAMVGSAKPDNPEFVELMQQFDALVNRTDELIDKMEKSLGSS